MKEHGILFSAPMVLALLSGSKTQTRRAVNPQFEREPVDVVDGVPSWDSPTNYGGEVQMNTVRGKCCPYGKPGDRLWVRETWMPDPPRDGTWPHVSFDGCKPQDKSLIPERFHTQAHCLYRATWTMGELTGWTPAIHMFRWASRITLEITDVRVERLQDISETDAIAEGITCENVIVGAANYGGSHHEISADRYYFDGCIDEGFETGIEAYAALWEKINGPGSLDLNPWVWVVEFKRIKP